MGELAAARIHLVSARFDVACARAQLAYIDAQIGLYKFGWNSRQFWLAALAVKWMALSARQSGMPPMHVVESRIRATHSMMEGN
jgi:hypothetical protein